jgi:hypothetical protein
MPERKVGIAFSCLNCEQSFNTSNAPVVHIGPGRGNPPAPAPTPAPVAAEPVARTVLSRSHLCSHPDCARELTAIGKRSSTLQCPHCHRSTSIYAILHRCGECDALLETPRRCLGTALRCPVCREPLSVPSDILYNDERALPDHTWFAFRCHGCGSPLQAPSSHARQEAVCPRCERPLTIPQVGERVTAPPPGADRDLTRALHSQLTRPCPHCGQPAPRQTRLCRHCGKGM